MRKTAHPSHTAAPPRHQQTADRPAEPDRLLTVPEVMARLHLSRTTVYDLLRSRQLRSGRVGRARRIPESSVCAYIAHLTEQED